MSEYNIKTVNNGKPQSKSQEKEENILLFLRGLFIYCSKSNDI